MSLLLKAHKNVAFKSMSGVTILSPWRALPSPCSLACVSCYDRLFENVVLLLIGVVNWTEQYLSSILNIINLWMNELYLEGAMQVILPCVLKFPFVWRRWSSARSRQGTFFQFTLWDTLCYLQCSGIVDERARTDDTGQKPWYKEQKKNQSVQTVMLLAT